MTSAVAVIDLEALQVNLENVRAAAPACRVLAVIKANAYGHGLLAIAGALTGTPTGADALAVARIAEAEILRAAGIEHPIVVFEGFHDVEGARTAVRLGLEVVVHTDQQVAILESADCGGQLPVWLKIDTGMGRLGIAPDTVAQVLDRLRRACGVVPGIRLMTHLACAEDANGEVTQRQLERFARAIGDWEGDVSIANSAAILSCPGAMQAGSPVRYAGDNWVRPGLMLYGASPLPGITPQALGLQPVMSFESRLIAVRRVKSGARVGYAGNWQAQRDSIIGVAAVGYGDGYPRRLANGTPVTVNGVTVPLAGRVSMDMITLDLTDYPQASAGDRVVLWGHDPDTEEIAGRAGTISYELMSGLTQRVTRVIRQKTPS